MKRIIILLLALAPFVTESSTAQGWWWWLVAQQQMQRTREIREQREQAEREDAQKRAREYAKTQKLVKKWQGRINVELPPPLATVLKAEAQQSPRREMRQQSPRREMRQQSPRRETIQPRQMTPANRTTAYTISERDLLNAVTVINRLKNLMAEKELVNRVLAAKCDSLQNALATVEASPGTDREPVTVNEMQPDDVSDKKLSITDSLKNLMAEKELVNRALAAKCDSLQNALATVNMPSSGVEEPNIFWAQQEQPLVKEKAYAPVKNIDLQPEETEGDTFAICFFVFCIGWILFWGFAIWPSSEESLSN